MSYTIDWGYTQAASTKNLAISAEDVLKWIKTTTPSNSPSTEFAEFTNSTQSARDRGPILKKVRRSIENVYSVNKTFSRVASIFRAPVKSAHEIVTSMMTFPKITDSVTGNEYIVPVWFEIKMGCSDHEAITGAVLEKGFQEFLATNFPKGSASFNQIIAQMNGSMEWLDETT